MEDYIIRATAANSSIRAFAATTKHLTEHARQIHHTSPIVTAALGRLLTAGAMMSTMMKGEKDLLTLQIKSSGPIRGMTVTADSHANVKGYAVNPSVMLPPNAKGKLDVGGAVGPGILNVIRDIGMKEPYNGQTFLQTSEIAEDLTYYFATSEQIPSSVGLGVLMEKNNTVKQAGGFILQLMPFTEEDTIRALEERLAKVSSVTAMLEEGMLPEEILEQLLGGLGTEQGTDLIMSEKLPTRFACNCSRERVENAIISLGKKEIDRMIMDQEPIEVKCDFCNTAYRFDVEDLRSLGT